MCFIRKVMALPFGGQFVREDASFPAKRSVGSPLLVVSSGSAPKRDRMGIACGVPARH